ncbi:MAG: DUF3187 family protein [Candidatus Binatia bacterium]
MARRRGWVWAAIAVALGADPPAGTSPLAAEEFRFMPPAPTRNFQPIQLIFLNLPFESARTVGEGELEIDVQSAEINEIATSNGSIEATLKFESNRTAFAARYGVLSHWEIGFELPFITRFGGGLDPMIDAVESFFGAENPERKLFPDNTFGGFIVERGSVVLFEGDQVTFQPGDVYFFAKRELSLPSAWPHVAVRAAIKAPTGDPDQVLGSGEPDLGGGLAADWRPFQRLMLYGNVNLVYPMGPITPARLTLNPIVTESFAAHVAVTHRWSAMLHQATYTSPFHGTGASLLDGTAVEIGLGLNFAYSECFGAQLLAINNVSGVEQAADFSLLLALRWRPWTVAAPPDRVGSPASP